ncbi:glycosyltransferase family 4 protein [Thalassotalea sediminis]|uniref:glycosyltransferase family 4 protein n=1 Tax=Thalassotalea sediminis TaxID=1759089 RepID=UPI002572A323|nr:glycosyltransferase family 4 protein [Thalassotalea sediminis]
MKKLIIVSTRPGVGKGGISTALEGYIAGLDAQNVAYEYVESHWANSNTFKVWGLALFHIIKLALKHRKNAVFWFHLGPWFSSFRKFTLAIVPRLLGASVIGHVHSPATKGYLENSFFTRKGYQLLLSPYHTIVALTPWWKNYLSAYFPNKSIVVCPNPNNEADIETAKGHLLSKDPYSAKTSVNVLTMARLVEGKNVDKVIRSFNALPEHFSLTIAGDGELSAELKQLVKQLGLAHRVTFTGWISGEQKSALFHTADIFCLPSLYDSFGMVFIEAMANNVPVIALGWGPIIDVVIPETGELVSEANEHEISAALLQMSKHLEQYHLAGPKYVCEKYQPNIVVQEIIKLL